MEAAKVDLLDESKKKYREISNVGKAKYTVSFHDGEKKHKDGSDFYDIEIFSSKQKKDDFIKTLKHSGYIER